MKSISISWGDKVTATSLDSGRKISASIFRSFTMTIVLTIVVLSGILLFYFEQISLKQTYNSTLNNLAQTSQEASTMAVNVRSFAKQLYNDINVSKLLFFSTTEPAEINTALAQLNSYRATSPFIDSIYIYNNRTDTFYTSADISANSVWKAGEFYDTTAVRLVKHASEYEPLMPIPRKIPYQNLNPNDLEKERDCYTFLLYDTLSHNKGTNVIIVNISETQMHKNIDGMIANSESNTFIIDKKGVLVTNGWKHKMLSDLSQKSYIQKVMSYGDSEGYFVSDPDGVKSLVAFSAPDFLGWRYIRIIPYQQITSQIHQLRVVTTAIALIILLAGLLLSYLNSRRISSKVNGNLVKLSSLETERRNHFNLLRHDLIRNVLLGSGNGNPACLEEKFKAYNIKLKSRSRFSVAVLRIDRYREFQEKYSSEDRNLFKIGMMNIAEELLSPVSPCFAVDMGDDRIAVVLNPDDVTEIEKNYPETMWRDFQKAITDYIKVSVSIAVSSMGEETGSISRLYAQAAESLFHRLFYGCGCVIYADRIESLKTNRYIYPIAKEKQLLEELMLGRTAEVQRIFREIVEETAGYSYMSYHLAISHLAFSVNSAIATIQKNNDITLHLNMNSLFSCLNDAETVEEIYRPFDEVFESVSVGLEEKKSGRHDEVVSRIVDIIRSHYMDQGLCLDSIADDMGLSATYIGRLFKKQTLKTILSCIIDVRMDKACELLLTTNLAVGDIAQKTGFSNSPYFYKAFKKFHGVTPADFRKHGRLQEQEPMQDIV
jgi:two-component system response regulator YesN